MLYMFTKFRNLFSIGNSLTEIYDIQHNQDLIQWHLKTSTMLPVSCLEVVVLLPKKKTFKFYLVLKL